MAPARTLTALALALLLSACQDAFDITLVEGKAHVDTLEFRILPRGEPAARPRFNTVRLVEDGSTDVLWHLRAAPFGTEASQSSLRYGVAPDGFEAVIAAPRLQVGKRYVLVVSGKAHGQLRFEVVAGGAVRKLD